MSLAGSHLSEEGFLGLVDNEVGSESTCQVAGSREEKEVLGAVEP